MGICAYMGGQLLMLDEKSWLAINIAKVFSRIEVQDSEVPPQQTGQTMVLMALAWYTEAQSCKNRKGPSPNCYHKHLSKMSM